VAKKIELGDELMKATSSDLLASASVVKDKAIDTVVVDSLKALDP
jgi:hypothetical protein